MAENLGLPHTDSEQDSNPCLKTSLIILRYKSKYMYLNQEMHWLVTVDHKTCFVMQLINYLFWESVSALASLSRIRHRKAVNICSASALVLLKNSKATEAVSTLSYWNKKYNDKKKTTTTKSHYEWNMTGMCSKDCPYFCCLISAFNRHEKHISGLVHS